MTTSNIASIDINIKPQSPVVRVTLTQTDKRVIHKNVRTNQLTDLIKDSAATILRDADTGFISPNLVREVIAHGQVRRLYLFPEVQFNCRYRVHGREDTFMRDFTPGDNEWGIKTVQDERDGNTYLEIPNFVYRNFGLFIVNVNDESFNCVRHNYGCVSTDMFDRLSDASNLHFTLLNHFDTSVCWHGGFNRESLNSRDTNVQARTVHSYLNSNFNSDLKLRCVPNNVQRFFAEGLEAFLKTLFPNTNPNEIVDAARSRSGIHLALLINYYLSTVRRMKFEDYTQDVDGGDGTINLGSNF